MWPPLFPRDERWAFTLWVLLTSLSESELHPLGSDREGRVRLSVGLWTILCLHSRLVNSASLLPSCPLPGSMCLV